MQPVNVSRVLISSCCRFLLYRCYQDIFEQRACIHLDNLFLRNDLRGHIPFCFTLDRISNPHCRIEKQWKLSRSHLRIAMSPIALRLTHLGSSRVPVTHGAPENAMKPLDDHYIMCVEKLCYSWASATLHQAISAVPFSRHYASFTSARHNLDFVRPLLTGSAAA